MRNNKLPGDAYGHGCLCALHGLKAKIHPRKAKVDTTWLPENGRNWERKNSRSPVRDVFNMYFWLMRNLKNILHKSRRLASKHNDVKTWKCAWHHGETHFCSTKTVLYIQTNSLMNMIELINQEGAAVHNLDLGVNELQHRQREDHTGFNALAIATQTVNFTGWFIGFPMDKKGSTQPETIRKASSNIPQSQRGCAQKTQMAGIIVFIAGGLDYSWKNPGGFKLQAEMF